MSSTQLAIAQLAERCREETSNYRKGKPSDPQFCLEIFRRAVALLHVREQAGSAARTADEAAREALYVLYTPFIEANISQSALLAIPALREDIVQDTWLFFWRAVQKGLNFPTLSHALSYLRQTSHRAVLQALRKARTHPQTASIDDPHVQEVSSSPEADPYHAVAKQAFLDRVPEVLGRGSLDYRVFWMRYQSMLPPREIAPILARENVQIGGDRPTAANVSRLLRTLMRRLADDPTIHDLLKND